MVDRFDRLHKKRAARERRHRSGSFAATAVAGSLSVQRPDVVPGVPMWISNRNVAGGMEISAATFTTATTAQGDLGRNAVRGFDTAEVDLTVRLQFRIHERLSLQARVDFFNLFNHRNFGAPIDCLTSPQFSHATQMLGASRGAGGPSGGLNRLYQIGGPRFIQLALKLLF